MSAVISEQCLYAIPITAYISTDLEIFWMLLIILHCRVSFSAQQACCWTLFTHFLNCLHLLYVHKNRRPLDYSIRALAIYTVSLSLSLCVFFTSHLCERKQLFVGIFRRQKCVACNLSRMQCWFFFCVCTFILIYAMSKNILETFLIYSCSHFEFQRHSIDRLVCK